MAWGSTRPSLRGEPTNTKRGKKPARTSRPVKPACPCRWHADPRPPALPRLPGGARGAAGGAPAEEADGACRWGQRAQRACAPAHTPAICFIKAWQAAAAACCCLFAWDPAAAAVGAGAARAAPPPLLPTGAKLDVTTMQRRGQAGSYRMRQTALRRLHGKESLWGPLQLMMGR